ncbi:uncharacterized protein L969DRAFT_60726 [Mixia osmundae IAM 14324]|uniref:Alpha-aminoadipate reductase n=2 Tax=Mixia osmundae TaxID=34349 RepID=G7E9M0_MIXOS|nr:uncharacterized protein L969DRAFT_60726 [Mixia osmundae IAM 14324]KEI39969.1 hypothetical protein L969DRAFT_60726 [Mixia osmundae IAM 14324]GAA99339.1 hypothetical protein E5Q_06034 [Mixia osmundae IAM 14324]
MSAQEQELQTRLARWCKRLSDLPAMALPTDYPRPTGAKAVETHQTSSLAPDACKALAKLASSDEEAHIEDDSAALASSQASLSSRPTDYQLLLSCFVVLLHRYTSDTDLVIATLSRSTGETLLLRIKLDPQDSFWSLVRRIQFVAEEAERDAVSFDQLQAALAREPTSGPLYRVRFIDETHASPSGSTQSASAADFSVYVGSSDATPLVRLHYNSLVFSDARIKLVLDQLSQLVLSFAQQPLSPLGTVSLLTPSQLAILPDPRADLDFCGFKGAITDVFSANAAQFPDRTCIVESVPGLAASATEVPKNETRHFTYKQIDEASNILAHHLIRSGVQREEVVTVYSTRGVDLVVAVMGVLKAGATFSVIDPAYPAARQNIYLQVAQPRALVILARAGELIPSVRAYVEQELQIRCEIPALQIADDGSLTGGRLQSSTRDVLEDSLPKASLSAGIALGPDSIATLSFTSGSTGIPKGVRGRHYSLTHFFPWMSQTFGIDASARFTMLSGIAHDPIQRDIFTPLFLGAQLHIPTAEDIGTPGRLAEWMDDSKVTVTHLTPAMGQLLSAQAVRKIPSLRNAFFVGDILTKRDCTRLQQLAHNVRIINMFGTTETQRAVSYFAVPSISEDPTFLGNRKDVIPAGRGMIDVQLVVVNRNERTALCAVGEIGEIYVRSGGLSEGYLSLPEANAEKFVTNWFSAGHVWPDAVDQSAPWRPYWKGVRDRMYRTGDLGRYAPDGSVECTGRADDQIKIRGFRIELGEIDTHLSHHALVRENVTLVRRDKDEEKVLVSYFVPMDGPEVADLLSSDENDDGGAIVQGMRRHKRLIKQIRDYLKTKLPAYSVPTLFVPLSRMPLNPNGKIDKPALPFPDTALAAAASSVSSTKSTDLSSTERTLHDIWRELLPSAPANLPKDASFFDLGGHSILATRLVFDIRKAFVVNLPLGALFDHPTIEALANEIERLQGSNYNLATGSKSKASLTNGSSESGEAYGSDSNTLMSRLQPSYQSPKYSGSTTVFLTGATGFLGAFILRDLLLRASVSKVICHVRASSAAAGLDRLRDSCIGRAAWDERWVSDSRLEVVVGELEKPRLGLDEPTWSRIAREATTIIHNAALVHWVYPYTKLRSANVLATLTTLDLASTGQPKAYSFVSSTAVFETDRHYNDLSDQITSKGGLGVPESDDLEGSRVEIKSGYGQSKWVSEKLIMEAGRRGLRGSVIRPAYIVGDSVSAVTNTDDFLWRLVKGCIQLKLIPDIQNSINMMPVDHVARVVALSALEHAQDTLPVYQVTSRPNVRFSAFLGALKTYGYDTTKTEYLHWRTQLEQHVAVTQDNALFPLLHFVLDDLPTSTKAPALDDSNTAALLERAGECSSMTVDDNLMGVYLAWLVAADFLPVPTKQGTPLPRLTNTEAIKAIGRSGH